MESHPSVRSLRIIGLTFVPVIAGAAIAVFALRSGWDEPDEDLATIGVWITVVLAVVGLVAAARWRARVTETTVAAPRLTTGFFITLAFAEAGMLAGFVFTIAARDTGPFLVGAAVFAVSLVVMLTSLGSVEIEADGTPSGIVR